MSNKPSAQFSPSLPPGHPRTDPCLSSCCRSRPGPRAHPRRSPRRIWERHAGSRPGCWALTSQSTAATIRVPPRHRTPTLSVCRRWGAVWTRATGKALPNLESVSLAEKWALVDAGEESEPGKLDDLHWIFHTFSLSKLHNESYQCSQAQSSLVLERTAIIY